MSEDRQLAAGSREARLRQVRQAEKLIALGRLAAGVVHEIGAPLNVIIGQTERLETLELDSPVRAAAMRIRDQAVRIERLLRRLARFARDREPARVELDVREAVEEAVELAALAALDSRVRLSVHNSAEPCIAEVDPAQLQQVITNLLLNAIEAVDAFDAVRVGCERAGAEVVLWVEDDGCGISAEHVARLFEPFVGSKSLGAHVGLGLSIVREIVDAHGGVIDVESAVDVGTCVRVRLPAA